MLGQLVLGATLYQRFLPVGLAIDNPNEQPRRNEELLSQSRKIRKTITSGDVHSYALTLDINQYARILIEPQGIALRATITAPDGQTLLSLQTRLNQPTALSFIAAGKGDFRVEVRPRDGNIASGSYDLSVAELRQAKGKDSPQVEAVKLFAEAESSRPWANQQERRAALEKYSAALRLSRQAHDGKGEADVLNGLSEVSLAISDNRQSLGYANAALLGSQSLKYLPGQAAAFYNLGEAQYALGERRKALGLYQQALTLWHKLGEAGEEAQTLLECGYVYADLVETNEAFNSYRQALSLWETLNDIRGKANTLTATGHLHNKLGERQKALNLYRDALPLLRQIGDKKGEAMTQIGFGFAYEKMGASQQAIIYYEAARQIYQSTEDQDGTASVLLRMGETYFSAGDLQQSLSCYQQSLTLFRALSNTRLQAYLLRDIGTLYEASGKPEEALAYYRQSRQMLPTAEDRRAASITLSSIGHVYESLGDKQQALAYYEQALALNRITQDHWAEAQTRYNLAHDERALGHLDRARKQIEDSLVIVESMRMKVASYDLRASYFATVRQYYELYIDVLMQLDKENPAAGYAELALQASEKARARSLLDILAQGNGGVEQGGDPELVRREKEMRQELNAKDERRMKLLGGVAQGEEIATITREIEQLTLEYEGVKTRIRETSPHYAALTEPQILSLTEMQGLLDGQTVMLQYALGEERSYLWVLSQDHLASYTLPSRAEIENVVIEVRKALLARQPEQGESSGQRMERIKNADEQFNQQAAVLSEQVLAPAAGVLRDKRLLIIPDAALQYVPFEALPEPQASVGKEAQAGVGAQAVERDPLMVGHEIVYQPSASALALLIRETAARQLAPKTIAALADPVFEQDDTRIKRDGNRSTQSAPETPAEAGRARAVLDDDLLVSDKRIQRLPGTREEVEAILSEVSAEESFKAIGFEANKTLATSTELAQYRIVHFATHGLLNSQRPELSSLVLSRFNRDGQAQDGFLRLTDIYNLHLPVELVVLSACNTGLGKDIRGEGLVGLTRGFMYAGAPRVLASLWKVDDEATAELMKHFYRGLLRDGLPPAAALRQAQLTLWRQKSRHAPYFWAAFVLQGEYKQPIPAAPKESRRPTMYIALIGLLIATSLGGIWAARHRRSRIALASVSSDKQIAIRARRRNFPL